MKRRTCLNIFLWVVFAIGLIGMACTFIQVGILSLFLRKGNYAAEPYQQENPFARMNILFLGDSTAVGTGADCPHHTVAGYFAKDFPQANIVNFSRNGRKLDELLREWQPKAQEHYQLAVIQIGGNDILRFTPFENIKHDLPLLLAKVKAIADHVVILHSGNVGLAAVFVWPYNWIMTERTVEMRDIYIQASQNVGVVYVDLFKNLEHDPMIKNIPLFYSPDCLHPSAAGYHKWYEQIQLSLRQAGVKL